MVRKLARAGRVRMPGFSYRAVSDTIQSAGSISPRMMQARDIAELIEAGMASAEVRVTGADGVHFEAVVISPEFAGKRPLERHQMVYGTLGERMGQEIHALALKTYTPEEWAEAETR